MKLPWVSREHHEYVLRQLHTLTEERQKLLDHLLGDSAAEPVRIRQEAVHEDAETQAEPFEQASPVSFTTPFDSIGARFDKAHKNGVIPSKFRVRI